MSETRGVLRAWQVWLEVAALLLLFSAWVQWWFVPHWLAPRFGAPIRELAVDDIPAIVEFLPQRQTEADLIVVVIGDSTVAGLNRMGNVGRPLREILTRNHPDRRVEVLDLSIVGLYATDALLLAAHALELRPDLVVWAVSPRVLPRAALPQWATTARDLPLHPTVLRNVGFPSAWSLVGAGRAGRTLLHSWWQPARLRKNLAQAFIEMLPGPPGFWNALFPPLRSQQPIEQPDTRAGGFTWTHDRYGFEPGTPSTTAMERMIRLCGRLQRCVLYHAPLNPEPTHGFEPGMLEPFVEEVNRLTHDARVPFHDLRRAVPTDHFNAGPTWKDAVHLTPRGAQAFAERLAPILEKALERTVR